MLERLWRVTNEWIYGQGGLYQVLTSAEMLEADPAADREDRRARAGYVAASSARSFLAQARPRRRRQPAPRPRRAIRSRAPSSASTSRSRSPPVGPHPSPPRRPARAAGAAGEGRRRGCSSRSRGEPAAHTLLARALVTLAARDSARHDERMRELGYLANVLLAGAARGRRLRRSTRPRRPWRPAVWAWSAPLADLDCGGDVPRERAASTSTPELRRPVSRRAGASCTEEVSLPALAAVERLATRLSSAAPTRTIARLSIGWPPPPARR
jgi:hypothetical protein